MPVLMQSFELCYSKTVFKENITKTLQIYNNVYQIVFSMTFEVVYKILFIDIKRQQQQ